MKTSFYSLLGKYRDLLIAITLFVVIDLGVLLFNYQASHLIEADTSRINRAGEMRMFSQQLTKAILTLRQETLEDLQVQTSLAQISEAYLAHNEALDALQLELNTRQWEMLDDPAQREQAKLLLRELMKTWQPLAESVLPLLAGETQAFSKTEIEIAANKAVARNIRLMQQADDLTKHLEGMAVSRAHQMRQIQLLAIILALLNFVFIVFKFLRNLAHSDRLAAESREETERILETVREGLFLLGKDGRIGSQQSASTESLLGYKLAAGESFYEFLYGRMTDGNSESVQQFISLLFNEKVKPRLMRQLNPLRQIEFCRRDGETRYLDFEFQQVLQNGRVAFLLVSVSDITEKVLLEKELAGAEARIKSEVESLLAVLDQDPLLVSSFLDEAQQRLQQINLALQQVAPSAQAYQQLVNQIARTVHGIKGEAGALGLLPVEKAAHAFENTLAPLRGGGRGISGDQLIPVAVAMNEMLEEISKVSRIVVKLKQFSLPVEARRREEVELGEVLKQIERLTLRVAEDLNKKVRFEVKMPEIELPRSLLGALREALPQLIRNAVAHGIESKEERMHAGKPEEGTIRCSLDLNPHGQLILAVEDDGRGLDPHVLRQQVIAKGILPAEQVATMSDEEVAGLIFTPGFSSLAEAGTHAGRGDGLAVVKEVAERFGARLQISSRPQSYTRFSLLFGDNRWLFAS